MYTITPLSMVSKAMQCLLILCVSEITSNGLINSEIFPDDLIKELITAVIESKQENRQVFKSVLLVKNKV